MKIEGQENRNRPDVDVAAVTAIVGKNIQHVIHVHDTITGRIAKTIRCVIAGIRIGTCGAVTTIGTTKRDTGRLGQLETIACFRTAPSLWLRTINHITLGRIALEKALEKSPTIPKLTQATT